MVNNNNNQRNSKNENETKTVNAGLSVAFYNKTIRDGFNASAYAHSFKNSTLTTAELVNHIRSGSAFCMATFANNKRQRGNFIQSQLLALDLDEVNLSVAELLEHDIIKRYAFCVYETATSTPEQRKARVLFRLDTPVTDGDVWETLQIATLQKFSELIPDEACKDASRLFYGSDNGDSVTHADNVLPLHVASAWVDELDSVTEPQRRTDADNKRIIEQNKLYTRNADTHHAYASATLERVTAELSTLTNGRNKALFNASITLGTMISADMVDEHTVLTALYNSAVANGYEAKRGDALAVITRGIQYGLKKPFDLSKLTPRQHKRRVNLNNAPTTEQRINASTFDLSPLSFSASTFGVQYIERQHISDALLEHDILALRSGMGTGKTHALSQYVRSKTKLSVLFVSPFEQLTIGSALRFGLDSYKDVDTYFMPSCPRLAITAKSLTKLQRADGQFPAFDMVIIDEVDHIHAQFNSKLYERDEALKTQHAYSELLTNAKHVVVTSAHITDGDIEAIDAYTHRQKTIKTLHNTFARDMKPLTLYNNYTTLVDNALNLAHTASAPVMFACGSINIAKQVVMLATQNGLKASDIFMLSSENSYTDEARAIISKPNHHIPNYKLFVYTFSAGVGMDYTGACAGVFGIFNNRKMTPLADIQMLERARHADTYNAYVMPGVQDVETNGLEILARWKRNAERTARIVAVVGALPHVDTYLKLSAELIAQQNHTRTDKLACFVALAREQGHAIEFNEQRSTKAQREQWAVVRAELNKIKRDGALSVDYRLSALEFKQRRVDRTLSDVDRSARIADIIEQTTGVLLDEETYDLFNTSQTRQQLRLFTDVFARRYSDVEKQDVDEALDNTPLNRRTHYTVKKRAMLELLMVITGTSCVSDLERAIKNAEPLLKEQWLERVKFHFSVYEQEIKDVFGWRSDYSKDLFALLQWLLSRVGLRLVRGKRSSHGARGYYYAFDVDAFDMLARYAKTRREHLATLTDVDNPLSKSRIEYGLLIRKMDKTTPNVDAWFVDALTNAERTLTIPI